MPSVMLIILSGLMLGLSRLPLYCGWLGFINLIPLLYYFDKGIKPGKILFRDAFILSAINFTLFMHWIWGVTPGGFFGIIIFYTIYYYLVFLALQLIWKKIPQLRYPAFILVFITLEYIQNFWEFKFPWINLGYSLADYTVLLQAADIGGVTLLSSFLLLINVWLYLVMQKKKKYLILLHPIPILM
jgi:apolipoprotein N-acyltransferase